METTDTILNSIRGINTEFSTLNLDTFLIISPLSICITILAQNRLIIKIFN